MPVACYANQRPIFKPAMRIVAGITNGDPALITTTFDHGYITGLIVRLYVPDIFGMIQVNKLYGPIEVVNSTTFYIDIDTTLFDPFTIPVSPPAHYTCAQCVPIGEVNELLTGAVQNVLP